MRIINVVRIKAGILDNIESFGVFEEQLSNDVVEKAEKEFIKQAKELGCNLEEYEEAEYDLVEDGYYCNPALDVSVCISWSIV